MRKSIRWLSTLLIIAVLFTGTVMGAYASENVQVDDLSTKVKGKVNESAIDKMPQIMEELKILEDHGISADYLKEVGYEDKLAYEFQLPSVQEVTQISLRQYDGGIIIEYTEGTKHDVVDHRENGDVYLDGEKVEVVIDEKASTGVDLSPRAGTRTEYSDTSFVSGGSYILDDNGSVICVHADKKLIEMATSTIADLLVSCLLGEFGIMVPIAKLLLHASSIQTLAERVAPDTEYLSFKWYKFHHSTNDAFIKYYKYSFLYFATMDLKGSSTTQYLYQRTLVY